MGVAILLLCAAIVVVILPDSIWKAWVVKTISHRTGREARIDGDFKLHLFSFNPELTLERFSLGNAPWAGDQPMLTLRRLDVTVKLWSLIFGTLTFPRIAIDEPTVDFQRDSQGRINWEFGPPAGAKAAASAEPLHLPVIQQLAVSQGRLSLSDRIRKLSFHGGVSIDEKLGGNYSGDKEAGLALRGSGTLNAKPFELRLNGSPLINVDHSHPYSFDAAVTAADIKLTSHVTIAHPFDLAAVHAQFTLSARNLADVYYLTGLALPNTPPYSIAGTLQRDNLKFKIDDLRGKIGESDISGNLEVDTDRSRPKLSAKLASKQLNFADLAVPLGTGPAAQSASDSTLKPAGEATKGETAPQKPGLLLPDADLQVDRVRGMDADVSFDAASVNTQKLPLKKVHFHLALDNGKLAISPLAFTLPQGQFSGSVAIDARGAVPQTDLDMQLLNVDLGQFKSKDSDAPPPLEGQLLGRVRLHGAGASVHKAASTAQGDVSFVVPKGQMREVFAELTGINISRGLGLFLAKSDATTEVRCGVANFHADNGDLNANALVIDTTHVLISGRGHIDLKTEGLDLSLHGEPKEIRLLRLRSPITVRGSLLQPKIGVDAAKALGQAGGAAALGALLTPVAAVLAFIDRGLAKDANCAALLAPVERQHDLHPNPDVK